MPFITLDNSFSNLAQYYNRPFANKPEIPKDSNQFKSFDDGLIRGGVLNVGLASIKDTARIGNFLKSPKGLIWVAKQVGLQRSNPKLETPEKFITLSNNNTRLYNLGINTLAQVPLNALGGHIIRHGILPVSGGGYLNNDSNNVKGYSYEKVVKAKNLSSKVTTSSITKTNDTLSKATNTAFSPSPIGINNRNTGNFIPSKESGEVLQFSSPQDAAAGSVSKLAQQQTLDTVIITTSSKPAQLTYQNLPNRLLQHLTNIQTEDKKIKSLITTPIKLLSYSGGPDSIYGIGKTIISTNPEQRTNVSNDKDDPKNEVLNNFKVKPYSELDKLSQERSSTVQRQKQTYIAPFDQENVEDRIGVSKVGQNNINRSVDAINSISIMDGSTFYKYSKSATNKNYGNELYSDINQFGNSSLFTYSGDTTGVKAGNFGRDIIKFRIEFINNEKINETEILAFRAYIDDFNDGMTAKWNTYNYMGRGEDFYVYNGFTREISVSFTMYAHSPKEMKPLYQKLNYLMSTFAPDYSSKLKMRGNIAKLTVGDYLYQQPGIFTDIKLSGILDTHWEIALNDPEKGSDMFQYEVPKHIKVSLTFKPIHNFLPRRAYRDTLANTPFITPNDKDNKYLSGNEKVVSPKTLEIESGEKIA